MRTMPANRLSLEDFQDRLMMMIGEQFLRDEGKTSCRACGSEAVTALCCVSVHTVLFEECSGSGEVKRFSVPWCRTCEGSAPPAVYACIHDELF